MGGKKKKSASSGKGSNKPKPPPAPSVPVAQAIAAPASTSAGEQIVLTVTAKPSFFEAVASPGPPAPLTPSSDGAQLSLDKINNAGVNAVLAWFSHGLSSDSAAKLHFPATLKLEHRALVHKLASETFGNTLEAYSEGLEQSRAVTVVAKGAAPKRSLTAEQEAAASLLYKLAKNDGLTVSKDEIADQFLSGGPKGTVGDLWNGVGQVQMHLEGLSAAARLGQLGTIQAILSQFPDLLKGDIVLVSSGETPLHAASAANQGPALQLLLASGADPEAKNASGQTPLQVAVKLESCDAEAILLQNGAKDVRPESLTDNNSLAALINANGAAAIVPEPLVEVAGTASAQIEAPVPEPEPAKPEPEQVEPEPEPAEPEPEPAEQEPEPAEPAPKLDPAQPEPELAEPEPQPQPAEPEPEPEPVLPVDAAKEPQENSADPVTPPKPAAVPVNLTLATPATADGALPPLVVDEPSVLPEPQPVGPEPATLAAPGPVPAPAPAAETPAPGLEPEAAVEDAAELEPAPTLAAEPPTTVEVPATPSTADAPPSPSLARTPSLGRGLGTSRQEELPPPPPAKSPGPLSVLDNIQPPVIGVAVVTVVGLLLTGVAFAMRSKR